MAELDLPELHSRALADTGLVVDAIKPDDLSLPTPCPDWHVAALAVVEWQADLLVASGAFAAPHGDPPDQSAQSRLLHLLGRTG